MRGTTAPTLREALAAFRGANGLPADEAANSSWTCRLGAFAVRLPNFAWRRKAILAHDIHHVLTGYPCTLRGECQMAAWEFGAGRMPHWGATWFCLPLVLLGVVGAPRRTLAAFLAGRRSRSLHGTKAIDRLLATLLSTARSEIVAVMPGAPLADRARFALLVLRAVATALTPPALFMVLLIALAAT